MTTLTVYKNEWKSIGKNVCSKCQKIRTLHFCDTVYTLQDVDYILRNRKRVLYPQIKKRAKRKRGKYELSNLQPYKKTKGYNFKKR